MTKKDLVELRNRTTDPEVKAALRYAINRIEEQRRQIQQLATLASVMELTAQTALKSD